MKKFAAILAGAALAAFAGCATETVNTNTANTANGNTAVLTNSNNTNNPVVANTNANTNANATTRRTYNANISEAEYERDKDRYGREAKEGGDTVGSGLKDGWLWTKTKGALATVDDLRDSTINVDVDNSVVTLRGTVSNAAHKAAAEKTAKGIDGVKSVNNRLTVSATDSMMSTNDNKAGANANRNGNANRK
ncbi:MAG: BON domain-containing protein [Pyrinomonadaceae bacterium]|nr:BON domain-containing protein [Pyrinomonadaceae bacterium]